MMALAATVNPPGRETLKRSVVAHGHLAPTGSFYRFIPLIGHLSQAVEVAEEVAGG